MRRSLIALLAVFVMACSSGYVTIPADCGALRIAGTFSDLHVQDGVGFFGTEVTVVPTDDPYYQVVLQFGLCEFEAESAQGTSRCFRQSNLVVVDALTESRTKQNSAGAIEFTVPEPSSFAGVFEGVISDAALVGTFRFASGKTLRVQLPRTHSYWQE